MERKLVEQAMHGDEAAFDALIERVGDHLHSVARRILRDPYLAEDATQRALLDAWRNLPRLRDPDRFEAWALPAARQRLSCRSATRTTSSRATSGCWRYDEPLVLDSTAHIATQHQLDQAFRRLGVEHRTVVVLIHYLGLSAGEAAEVMGTPVGTVRSRLHYALQTPACGRRGRRAIRDEREHGMSQRRPASSASSRTTSRLRWRDAVARSRPRRDPCRVAIGPAGLRRPPGSWASSLSGLSAGARWGLAAAGLVLAIAMGTIS